MKSIQEMFFLSNYLTANEVDGYLYWLSPTFSVDTMIMNDNLSGGIDSWTLQNFVDVIRDCDAQGIGIMEYQSQETLIQKILPVMVDEVAGICYFDDAAFLDLLEFSEEMRISEEPNDETMSDSELEAYTLEETMKYQNGQRLLMCADYYGYEDYLLYTVPFGDEPHQTVGYPVIVGNNSGYIRNGNSMLAITSTCTEVDAAWDFLKSVLDVSTDFVGMPILTDALETYIRDSAENITEQDSNVWTYNGVEFPISIPTEESITAFMTYLQSVDQLKWNNQTIVEMEYDVLQDFYNGNATAAETTQLLQERIGLYLKENS